MHLCIYTSMHLCVYASMRLCIYASMRLCVRSHQSNLYASLVHIQTYSTVLYDIWYTHTIYQKGSSLIGDLWGTGEYMLTWDRKTGPHRAATWEILALGYSIQYIDFLCRFEEASVDSGRGSENVRNLWFFSPIWDTRNSSKTSI
jgi:hypothetical protein